MITRIYRQLIGSDVWHYVKTCQHWPLELYRFRVGKYGSGELCNECKSKARKAKNEISNRA